MSKLKQLLFIILLFISGCRMPPPINPESHFVFIEGNIVVYLCSIEAEKAGSEHCVGIGEGVSKASGVLIEHKKDKSYYLTAGHVCSDERENSPDGKLYTKINKEIHLLNKWGDNVIATVVAMNHDIDLCLLSSERAKGIPISMSNVLNKKGDAISNIAAPGGVWDKDMMLHFEGVYQGDENKKSIYVLVAQPGSSGSPIMNSQGKLVGIVTHVLPLSFAIAYSPTLEDIKKFVELNLPNE